MAPMTHRITLAHLQALGFWDLVDVGAPGECWHLRSQQVDRRAVVHISTRITGIGCNVSYLASRAAKALHDGRLVPPRLVVDHLCFNTRCVNPAHLDVVTQRTNLDRRRKAEAV